MSVRLDAELRRRLEEFAQASGLESSSQALRAVIMLGLARGDTLEPVWRRAVALEAARGISAKMRLHLQSFVNALWAE